jgi:hypothetical protein
VRARQANCRWASSRGEHTSRVRTSDQPVIAACRRVGPGAIPTFRARYAGNDTDCAWASTAARSALRMNPCAMALSKLFVHDARKALLVW